MQVLGPQNFHIYNTELYAMEDSVRLTHTWKLANWAGETKQANYVIKV